MIIKNFEPRYIRVLKGLQRTQWKLINRCRGPLRGLRCLRFYRDCPEALKPRTRVIFPTIIVAGHSAVLSHYSNAADVVSQKVLPPNGPLRMRENTRKTWSYRELIPLHETTFPEDSCIARTQRGRRFEPATQKHQWRSGQQ